GGEMGGLLGSPVWVLLCVLLAVCPACTEGVGAGRLPGDPRPLVRPNRAPPPAEPESLVGSPPRPPFQEDECSGAILVGNQPQVEMSRLQSTFLVAADVDGD